MYAVYSLAERTFDGGRALKHVFVLRDRQFGEVCWLGCGVLIVESTVLTSLVVVRLPSLDCFALFLPNRVMIRGLLRGTRFSSLSCCSEEQGCEGFVRGSPGCLRYGIVAVLCPVRQKDSRNKGGFLCIHWQERRYERRVPVESCLACSISLPSGVKLEGVGAER